MLDSQPVFRFAPYGLRIAIIDREPDHANTLMLCACDVLALVTAGLTLLLLLRLARMPP